MGTPPSFVRYFARKNNFHDFLFVFVMDKVFQKGDRISSSYKGANSLSTEEMQGLNLTLTIGKRQHNIFFFFNLIFIN